MPSYLGFLFRNDRSGRSDEETIELPGGLIAGVGRKTGACAASAGGNADGSA